MNRLVVLLLVATAATILLVGPAVAWARVDAPYVGALVLPTGAVVHYPGASLIRFTVGSAGGTLVGSALVDHTSIGLGVEQVGVGTACGFIPTNWTYEGPAWNYTIDQHLGPGSYWFGDVCGGFANLTVTQSFEVWVP